MSQIQLKIQYISIEGDDYCIRYLQDNQVGKYYSETNEIFKFSSLGGVRVFSIAGDYGGEFINALIAEARNLEIDSSSQINKDDLIKTLEKKHLEALAKQ